MRCLKLPANGSQSSKIAVMLRVAIRKGKAMRKSPHGGNQPVDLPLETLPMLQPRDYPPGRELDDPLAQPDNPPSEQYRVGPGKPPLETRWCAGKPSPNPRGRPRKRRGGALTQQMEMLVEVTVGGQKQRISRRKALDTTVRNNAIRVGRKWSRLWDEREKRDLRLEADRQAFLARQRVIEDNQAQYPESYATALQLKDAAMKEKVLSYVDKALPGFQHAFELLVRSGIIELRNGEWQLTDFEIEVASGDEPRQT